MAYTGAPESTDSEKQLLAKLACAGLYGFVHTTSTSPVVGSFCAIVANVDSVLASVTEPNSTGTTNITLKAGAPLFGQFSSFTLTSGEVTAYKFKS